VAYCATASAPGGALATPSTTARASTSALGQRAIERRTVPRPTLAYRYTGYALDDGGGGLGGKSPSRGQSIFV
jgi:hypothetical protein